MRHHLGFGVGQWGGRHHLLHLALCVALLVGIAHAAHAQEIYVLGGLQQTPSLGEKTYGYTYEYAHNLTDNVYASFSYLNEGHVTNHHRDGHSAQLWGRLLSTDRRFAFSLGVGPYRYFDTTVRTAEGGVNDQHGWGILISAAANWYINGGPWIAQARYNRAQAFGSIDTNTFLIGVGYQLDRGSRDGPVVPPPSYTLNTTSNELTVFGGTTIINNFDSPSGTAFAVEYRRGILPYVDLTATYLNEGDARVVRRQGVAAQAWLVRPFFNDHLTLGIGLGPYVARDRDEGGGITHTLGLFTMSASYRISRSWTSRFSWHRTVTTNSRDSDVMVLGLGYRF
ncbi:hypothetical protein [Cupriavidus basilensis]|uniref:hypothetical protein n=1 Tax=Cupriavidus basilensis TaxID=68895 RepID=UPI0039F710BD